MKFSFSLRRKKKSPQCERRWKKRETPEKRRAKINVDSGLCPLKENEGYFMQAFSPQVRLNPGTMGKKIVRICCAHQRFAIFSFFSLRLQQGYNLHYNGITVNGLWRFILLFFPSLTWHPSAGPESMLRNALSAMAGRERGWTRSEHKVKKKNC